MSPHSPDLYERPVRILALDLATRTGWASWDGRRRESGFVDFDIKRGESPGMRYLRFNRWLADAALNGESPRRPAYDLIAYEQGWGSMRSGAAAEVALGLLTRVQEFCAHFDVNHTAVNGTALKKWVTGKGNAKKPAMVAAVLQRFCNSANIKLDDNESDAIAILHYVREEVLR